MTTQRLVPFADLNLRARVNSLGKILGFVDANGNEVMVAVADADGQIGTPTGGSTAYDINALAENTIAPVITGAGTYSVEHTVDTGTWTGEDITYTYQWKLDGVALVGETTDAYTPLSAQIGSDLTCTVTATTTAGAVTEDSAAVEVLDKDPVNSVAPVITGSGVWGTEHTVNNGTWTAGFANVYTYQWKLDGVAIGAATANAYTFLEAQLGSEITCTVTATTTGGNTPVTTAGVTVIAP